MNNQKLNNILKDPNTNWKYIVVVAIVGLVALAGILVYENFWSDSQEVSLVETPEIPEQPQVPSGWKTYRNKELGFEIKYPPQAIKTQNKEVFDKDILFSLNLSPTQTKWNNLSLDIATVDISNCYYSPLGQSIDQKKVSTNGLSFCMNVEEDSGTAGETHRNYYYAIKKGNEYLLLDFFIGYNRYCGKYPEYNCAEFDETKDVDVFNQILSTFKFIEKGDETANWKSYSGNFFSFRYPYDWVDNTGPASSYPDNLEVIGLRISPNAVFEASYQNYSYQENIQRQGISEKLIVAGKEAMKFRQDGIGETLPVGFSIISAVVEGSESRSYNIVFNGDRKDITEELISQILSTFKFLE